MAAVTAQMVKTLRERTGVGMMDCKKALVAAEGDIEAAIEALRKAGQAKAVKKSSRTAAEGRVEIQNDGTKAIVLEVNCETDFTAGNDEFKAFVHEVASAAHAAQIDDVAELASQNLASGQTVEQTREALVAKIGENMSVRRVKHISGSESEVLGAYTHGSRIGVVVKLDGGDAELAKDVAMHIAASNPTVINPEEVTQEAQDKEREIYTVQARESGKPDAVIEKMIEGRMRKFLSEVSLTGQPFVKDPSQTVGALLKSNNAKAVEFIRFEVGEGIEKEESNFAEEVLAQAHGA